MAAEITLSLVREKLQKLRDGKKIEDPKSLRTVNQSIVKLEESQRTLKSIEDDQGSPLTTDDDHKIKLMEAVYSAEDTIDTFLASTRLQKQKLFINFPSSMDLKSEHSQASLQREMENFVKHLTEFIDAHHDGNAEADVSGLIDDEMKGSPQDSPSNLEGLREGAAESKLSDELPVQQQQDLYHEDDTSSEDSVKNLVDSILNGDSSIFVLSVADRPEGSLKTTPLWKTYCKIKKYFECCAWIHVSDEYEAVKCIMGQLTGVKQEKDLPLMIPQGSLSRFLSNKKYLLVFYDLRTPEIWNSPMSVLPNSDVSRMILSFRGIIPPPHIPKAKFLGTVHGTKLVLPSETSKDVGDNLDEETNIVGMTDEIMKLDELIYSWYHGHFVILVQGRPGSGKTALVKTVYNLSHIKQKFEKRVWISVSKVIEERNLLLQILKQFEAVKDEEKLPLHELRKEVRTFFARKRSLLVLDDVQTHDTWDKLEKVFPTGLSNGSKVILTIRSPNIARNIDPSICYLHKLRQLTEDESWALFIEKVQREISNDSDLMKLKEKILQKCSGLPLAICMLGGLLSTKEPSYDAWLKVIESSQQKKKEERRVVDHLKQEKEQEAARMSEHTKQGEKEEERVSEHIKREKKRKMVVEHTQQGEIQEEKVVEEEKSVSRHTQQGEIEEEERVTEHTQKGEIEEEKGVSRHNQQGEIEEEEAVEEEKITTVNASSDRKQGDQSISPNESDSSDNMGRDIFDLGYLDLPSPLRACLHYLCLFPQSEPILIRRLVRLWIAEGLVKPLTTDNEEPPPEPEDLLEEYLEKLERRKMIEVDRPDGKPKTCSVPGLVYDLLGPNSELMGFFHVHSNLKSKSQKLSIRRLAEQEDIQNNDLSDNIVEQLRSYISFNRGKGDKKAEAVGNFLERTITKRGFGLLTVLDLEGVYKPSLKRETLGKLPLLRYMGLRSTFLDEIPESVGDLPYLETLDVKHTNITALPISVCNAKKLRHLYMDGIGFKTSIHKPIPSDSLTNLRTLSGLLIGNSSTTIDWLKGLTGLRKLRLTCQSNSFLGITDLLRGHTNLRSLQLRSVDENIKPSKLHLASVDLPRKLTDLYLVGKLSEFNLGDLPRNLRVLTLSLSQLSEDPMPILGALKDLEVLGLYANSYLGVTMTCGAAGRFPRLQVLKLWMLLKLREWTIEEGALPALRKLEIRCCQQLLKPAGLEKMTTLEELTLTNMKDDFVAEVEGSVGKKKVKTNNWQFNPSWELSQEQQQEFQQRSEQRDAQIQSTTESTSLKSKSENKKVPSRHVSQQLRGS